MMPERYPEIHIFWAEDPEHQAEYKEAYMRLLAGQVEKVGEDTVGVVVVEGMRRVIPIVLVDGYAMSEIGAMLSAAVLITDSYFPVIFLEEEYYLELARNPVRRSNIYHEVGHIVLKHLKKKDGDQRENAIARASARENNELFWQEAEADLFAAHYVGKKNMLIHLNYLKQDIEKLIKDGRYTEESGEEALRETDLRIEKILSLD